MDAADLTHLARAVELAFAARAHGNHPFGATLVSAGGTVIDAENTVNTGNDPTGHAETNLVRKAAAVLDGRELAGSTLYTSTEPCAMCAGAIFWAGIGRVVFALGEDELIAMIPGDSPEGTLALPCREVFSRGGRETLVMGPVYLARAHEAHAGFWV